MKVWNRLSKTVSLREAATAIFGLSALLPLLLLVAFLSRHNLLLKLEAQLSILAALVLAVFGFVALRRMVDRISSLVRALEAPTATDATGSAGEIPIPGLGAVAEIGQLRDFLARLLVDIRSSTERLEDLVFKIGTLNETVELAARIPELQDLLALVLERTMRAVRGTVGSIMLLDRDRQKLRIVAARGVTDSVLADVELRVGSGIAGRVAQHGDPILVENIESDPRFAKDHHPAYGGGSFICMPIRVADRIIGVINLARREHGMPGLGGASSFTPTDLQFLNALMTYVAYALDNARLLEEALQSAKQLREVVQDQELRLTVAQQQMVQAEKLESVGRLAAGVAHEVKNPLMILLTGIKYLSKRLPTEDDSVKQVLEDMSDAVERADKVIRGLLDLSAPRELDMKLEDLNPIVEQSLLLVKHDLDRGQINAIKKLEDNLPPVTLDSFKIQQVLVNLFTNAIHAMPEGGMLTVKTYRRPPGGGGADDPLADVPTPEGAVGVEVDDTGTGIPGDKLKKIFDPFFTTKPTGKGTGLGLSISRQLVEMQGGVMDIRNRAEGGVRATILFKLQEGGK
ncbi:MAG: GAF domain-containing protein [Candidatus Rokubacteria bacterium]|nr:GAF domain-containing protein [Candidatus Rokubacteria bacterium]MBI2552941.1 GAF domain-containing protein [Candidatus Rokubacteria bacterium]